MKKKRLPKTRPIITRCFKIKKSKDFWYVHPSTAIQLCGKWIRRLWHIPVSSKAIWVSLYRHPGKDRVHVVVPTDLFTCPNWTATIERVKRPIEVHCGVYVLFEQLGLIDKNVYVGLEYEE